MLAILHKLLSMQENSGKGAGERRSAVRIVRVGEDAAGQRVDNFLRKELPGLPRSRLYRLLRRGEVRVNGGRVRADHRLRAGDEVRVPPARLRQPGAPPPAASARSLAERVLYEDARVLVVDKPAGVAAHGGSGIAHGAIERLRHARPDLPELALVHRLDRETSGCLVLAKRRSALRDLHEQFRAGVVEKNYLALVAGDWQLGERLVEAPLLVRHRRNGERHVIVDEAGKAAATRFRLARRYGAWSLLQCQPLTGRTHQIRVHAAWCGHPLVVDERYGDEAANGAARDAGLRRLFLHAQSIAFPVEGGGERHYTAPLAAELEDFLATLERALPAPDRR